VAVTARRRITLNTVHKWAGLVAALWLAVLAVTGIMQLNRQQWRWQWTSGPSIGETIAEHDDKYLWRHNQVNPSNPAARVTSGAAGAFLTRDGGKHWTRLPFGTESVRNVSALEQRGSGAGWTVYAGTDDGVWRLDPATSRMVPLGLQGKLVNSVSVGEDRLVAAVGMSVLFQRPLTADGAKWEPVELAPLPGNAGASTVDLGRLLQDIHLGRGLLGGMADTVLWNLVGLGLLVLSLTGVAYWAVMRWTTRIRLRPKEARPAPKVVQRAYKVIQWSFRVHAMIIGIVLALPLLLVFLTGLYQDHRGDVQMMFRKIAVPQVVLPPAYRGEGWRGQLMNVALASDAQGPFLAVGNRRGVFLSRDMGQSWEREAGFHGPAMRLRKIGADLYVPGRMMRRVQVRHDQGWHTLEVPKPVVMVNEMSPGPNGTIWWTRGETIFRTSLDGQMRGKGENLVPRLGYLPWASFAAELHEGALIWTQWKWVNDLVALLGMTLVITGFLRWRKRRW
jgi:uncharacterized iron-regulated membrane protein